MSNKSNNISFICKYDKLLIVNVGKLQDILAGCS